MRHSTPMILLALLTAVVPGCNCMNDLDRYSFEGDDDMGPADVGPDTAGDDTGTDAGDDAGADAGPLTECPELGAPVDYEIDSLVIPTNADVVAGATLGYDLDGTGNACGVTDYFNDVDNSLIDLAQALPALSPGSPIHLQADIDRGLSCSQTNAACATKPWTVRVERGTGCAQITILEGRSEVILAGPFLARVDGLGNARGEFDALTWNITHRPSPTVGGTVSIPLIVRDGTFMASIGDVQLGGVLIGGSLIRSELNATFTSVVGDLGDGNIALADVTPILETLYDVEVGGSCDALSVGLLGSASRCPGVGTPRLYRLTTLHVPTQADANLGNIVGQNVDGRGTVCGVPDYLGQVDNSLIDLAAALPSLVPTDPFILQDEIDAAIGCAATGATCTRLDIYVSIATGNECAVVSLTDAEGVVYASERVGTLSGGELSVRLPSWIWLLPIVRDGQSNYVSARLESVILTADVTTSTLTNVVLGGHVPKDSFEDFFRTLLPLLDDQVEFSDVQPILENLYDVERFGTCSAFSIGFTGAGVVVP